MSTIMTRVCVCVYYLLRTERSLQHTTAFSRVLRTAVEQCQARIMGSLGSCTLPCESHLERGHKALQQQTVRDPKYNNNNNKLNNNNNNKKNYLYLAATRFMTSLTLPGPWGIL
ncbi:unnamed protein product [Polarella glacialis]|uniref:Uncharacterized protein n=1 Tax=Polarella glacialis TaxID=89957 RepID=A0A813HKK4_POLGL|nr:unnamed protein product [Polarella glacialis]